MNAHKYPSQQNGVCVEIGGRGLAQACTRRRQEFSYGAALDALTPSMPTFYYAVSFGPEAIHSGPFYNADG